MKLFNNSSWPGDIGGDFRGDFRGDLRDDFRGDFPGVYGEWHEVRVDLVVRGDSGRDVRGDGGVVDEICIASRGFFAADVWIVNGTYIGSRGFFPDDFPARPGIGTHI